MTDEPTNQACSYRGCTTDMADWDLCRDIETGKLYCSIEHLLNDGGDADE